ncbi:hypothetical protein J6590_104262 [Homalodisca vitripennis]|nr:hypothetical protein J6590_104262 [Homalodisca vitripennis]
MHVPNKILCSDNAWTGLQAAFGFIHCDIHKVSDIVSCQIHIKKGVDVLPSVCPSGKIRRPCHAIKRVLLISSSVDILCFVYELLPKLGISPGNNSVTFMRMLDETQIRKVEKHFGISISLRTIMPVRDCDLHEPSSETLLEWENAIACRS